MRQPWASRLARGLVRCYPAAWRDHYAAEMVAVLGARPLTWGDLCNLSFHLLYTHLHPDLALTGAESPIGRLALLMRTLRSSEIIIFGAFVAAIIAWLQFGGLVDGGPYMPLTQSANAWPLVGASPANGISAALAVQSAAVDLAFLAVLIGGVPLALVAWRRSPGVRRLFLVPLAAFVLAVLPGPIALLLRGPVATINLTFTTPITDAYFVWFALLAGASVWALGHVISESDATVALLRFAYLPSAAVSMALVLLLGSTLAWGIAAHQEFPTLFDHSSPTLGYATVTTWAFDVLLMAAAPHCLIRHRARRARALGYPSTCRFSGALSAPRPSWYALVATFVRAYRRH